MRRCAEVFPSAGNAHPFLRRGALESDPATCTCFDSCGGAPALGLLPAASASSFRRLSCSAHAQSAPRHRRLRRLRLPLAGLSCAVAYVVICMVFGRRGVSFSAFRRRRRPFSGCQCPILEAPPLLAMAFPLRWCQTHIIEYSAPHTCLAGLGRSAVGNSCLSRSAIAGF